MTNLRGLAARYGMAGVLLLLIVFFAIMSDSFLSQQNITNVLRQIAMLGIASVGMTLVVLTGGIDLSVGSVLALTGIVVAIGMTSLGRNMYMACLLGLATGALVGLVNGISVTMFDIPPLITTLAMLGIARGFCYILTGGLPIFGFPADFSVFGRGMIGILPISVLTMIIGLVIGWVLLNRTRYGRYLYAIGGNREGARLTGIKVRVNLVITYVLAGLFTAVAGIIMLSRLNSAQPNTGTGFEMDVITAVVLGGVSISGGEGRFSGVIFGIRIIGVLGNGMILMNVQDYWQLVIKGAVLMLAVGIDRYSSRFGKVKAV